MQFNTTFADATNGTDMWTRTSASVTRCSPSFLSGTSLWTLIYTELHFTQALWLLRLTDVQHKLFLCKAEKKFQIRTNTIKRWQTVAQSARLHHLSFRNAESNSYDCKLGRITVFHTHARGRKSGQNSGQQATNDFKMVHNRP